MKAIAINDGPGAGAGGVRRGRTLTALAFALALLALAPAAQADDWRPVGLSCVNAAGTDGCANGSASFSGAWNVVVSPDGRHAYTTNYNANAVQLLDRDGATGALAPRGGVTACIAEVASATCSDGRALTFPDGIAISPDGRFVYVAGWGAASIGTVAVFSRDANSGLLAQVPGLPGCISADGSAGGVAAQCTDGRGLANTSARDVTMSADGASLYVGNNPIAVFDRTAASGALTQKPGTAACVATPVSDGCAAGRALGTGRQPALSSDGQSLYVPTGGGVAVFDRAADGTITQKAGAAGCITVAAVSGCGTEPRLGASVEAVLASPDGRQVYVSSAAGMLTFARGGGGGLGLQSCVTAAPVGGCATAQNVFDLSYSAISPDGQDVVAMRDLGGPNGMVFFARDGGGNLARRAGQDGCISADGSAFDGATPVPGACRSYPVVTTNGHVSFVGDSYFYAGFYTRSAVATFKRDFYPPATSPPPPSNEFSFGKLKMNKRKGTAKLTVKVPGPGALALAKTKKVKGKDKRADAAGQVKLAIKPKRKAIKTLKAKGKAKVKATVTYTPDGGTPNAQSKSLKLVKR